MTFSQAEKIYAVPRFEARRKRSAGEAWNRSGSCRAAAAPGRRPRAAYARTYMPSRSRPNPHPLESRGRCAPAPRQPSPARQSRRACRRAGLAAARQADRGGVFPRTTPHVGRPCDLAFGRWWWWPDGERDFWAGAEGSSRISGELEVSAGLEFWTQPRWTARPGPGTLVSRPKELASCSVGVVRACAGSADVPWSGAPA